MAKRDYYDVLGVEKSASPDQIKAAYRKQAVKYHPDKNKGDKGAEEKFKEASEAYHVLSNSERKQNYDNFGHAAFENGGGGRGGFGNFDFSGSFSDIFEDFFGEGFGGGGRRSRRSNNRGSDLRYDLSITLEEAYTGKKQDIKFSTSERCGGQGKKQASKRLSVTIPKGVDDGTRIRLSGKGEAGSRGASNGDLYLFINVESHELFKRSEVNLFFEFPISFTDAALGTIIEIPTIDGGKAKIKIPDGTQSGKQFRLKGKGMPFMRRGDYGDLYVQVNTEVPVSLNKEQKELLEKFRKIENDRSNPSIKRFFQKAKNFWKN